MSLVNLKDVLPEAQKNKYAVGAFTVWNMEYVQAVVEVAEELNSPAILMVGPVEERTAGKNGLERIAQLALYEIRRSKIPLVLHYDHSDSVEVLKKAIDAGFSSIMFDGSMLPYEKNVELTRIAVELGRKNNVSVKGEIGKVGGLESNRDIPQTEAWLTTPEEAEDFLKKTDVDALAISIGTVHGLYKVTPKINIERLKKIRKVVNVPLVLHGGSDTPEDIIRQTIVYGISKINICTDLKLAYAQAQRSVFKKDKELFDPAVFLSAGREAVKETVKKKIMLFGSVNKVKKKRKNAKKREESGGTEDIDD